MMVKVVEDLLLAGEEEAVQNVLTELERQLKVGWIIRNNKLIYNKFSTEQHADMSTTNSMEDFLDVFKPIDIPRIRRKEATEPCISEELRELRRIAGELNYIGCGVLPQLGVFWKNAMRLESSYRGLFPHLFRYDILQQLPQSSSKTLSHHSLK